MSQEQQTYNPDHRYCSRCGARLDPGANFCGNCGAATPAGGDQPVDHLLGGMGGELLPREYMGFWIRLAAALIDSVLILIFIAILGRIFGTAGFFIAYIFGLLYYVLLTTMQGQTVGKMVVGVQVVDSRGNIPSLGTVLLREVVGKFISSLFFNLGYVWAAWDREKRAWHDHIASTFVVRKERQRAF